MRRSSAYETQIGDAVRERDEARTQRDAALAEVERLKREQHASDEMWQRLEGIAAEVDKATRDGISVPDLITENERLRARIAELEHQLQDAKEEIVISRQEDWSDSHRDAVAELREQNKDLRARIAELEAHADDVEDFVMRDFHVTTYTECAPFYWGAYVDEFLDENCGYGDTEHEAVAEAIAHLCWLVEEGYMTLDVNG